jgi:hypothetical protein
VRTGSGVGGYVQSKYEAALIFRYRLFVTNGQVRCACPCPCPCQLGSTITNPIGSEAVQTLRAPAELQPRILLLPPLLPRQRVQQAGRALGSRLRQLFVQILAVRQSRCQL